MLDDVIGPKTCEEIILKFENDRRKAPGKVVKNDHLEVDSRFKSSIDLTISDTSGWEKVDKLIWLSAKECIQRYMNVLGPKADFLSISGDEAYVIRKYEGSDYYNRHADASSLSTVRRKIAALWYLNDVEEGGETFFENAGVEFKPKRGSALLFPTDWMYTHGGRVCIKPKYIIRTFFLVQ